MSSDSLASMDPAPGRKAEDSRTPTRSRSRSSAAAAMAHLNEVGIGCGIRIDQAGRLHGREVQVAAHQVLVFPRKQHQISGGGIENFRAVGEPHLAAAFGK